MPYYCNICKEPISEKIYEYCKIHFDRPLCRKHQDIAKLAAARLANSEQKTIQKKPEPKTNSNVAVKAPEITVQNSSAKSEDTLIQWLIQWASAKPISLSLDSKQFFLSGMELEELARDIIGKGQDEILVTSPYVDSCHLATALQRAIERRVKVKVVARRPTTGKMDALKAECQTNLRKEGVVIHYINQIHSKIIIIDRKIAIISSMNLYSGSTGGATFEAGIVSFDKKVVDSAAKYVVELLEKPESSDTNANSSRYDWKARRY
jgi:phosphatidylserine/phosphatidylglycerophosphate/cardiolipin synthase-like enzyme